LGEYVTGDIPAPAKRGWSAEMRQTLEVAEQAHADSLGVVTPPLSDFEAAVLKWADGFEGLLTCLVDVRRGNTYSRLPLDNFWAYVRESQKRVDHEGDIEPPRQRDREVATKCRNAISAVHYEIETSLSKA
jgi:5'-deoxynucleotidase YfbR-like HD superfamily hydrolase